MDLVMLTLRNIAAVITDPYLRLILIFVAIAFYWRNRKISMMQKVIIGESVSSPLELTLSQMVLGIIAGAIGSLILSGLGVAFTNNSGIEYVLAISMFFMFIKPRFVCLSYSAAFLGALSLVVSFITDKKILNIDIAMLMTFVGVVHIVEAILVMADGSRGTIPVFKTKEGRILGGYSLNRQWMLPIAVILAFSGIDMTSVAGDTVATPGWWPILSSPTIGGSSLLVMLPLFGILGYSSTTFTYSKEKKVVSSGMFILAYGFILCLVSRVATLGIIGEVVVIAFAPIAHELMLEIQKKIEDKRKYLFTSDEGGLSILEVIPNSVAYKHGFRRGDKIISVNNTKVNTEGEIVRLIKSNLGQANFLVMKSGGEVKEVSFTHSGAKKIGFLLVPRLISNNETI
ncbi:MAG: PDZ domain-containing protein, partial [Clostridium sp.]